jgi:glycosyltransferase involved in cell wall biosynthesis
MRICYIADAGSIHTHRWVRHFAEKGHEVHLISPTPFGDSNIEGVKLYVLKKVRPQIRIISYVINLLLYMIQVKRLLKRVKPDILHTHYVMVYGFLGALTGFHPFVLSVWGSDVLVAPKNSKSARFQVKFALKRADFVSTTSQYLKVYLHEEFNLPDHKVVAIPWGIDLGIFHKGYETEVKELKLNLGMDDSNFVILSPRHLRSHYRIEHIIQTLPHILTRHPNVTLILLKGTAQEKAYESQIRNLMKELGVAENVRLIHEELKPEDMAVLYNTSGALISIPKSDQFASSIQEGMACGTIPIVADLEVYHQYLTDGENAFFVNPEDPSEIAQRMIYCIENPDIREKFYAVNRRIIEDNEDWNKNARKMEELYMSLLAQKVKEY